ncbi:MAG: glutamate 5-kinase [Alphaproteobacteria bacterium]
MSYDLSQAKRVVVKVGSSLLVDAAGALREDWLKGLAQDVAALHGDDVDIVLVSSGAVALGASLLGGGFSRQRLSDVQAAAAVGQVRLAHAYESIFGQHGLTVAQVLLTLDDSEVRRRYLNARDTIDALLRLRAVPVINENDTVATSEIRYGDNDRLAARVAQMISADALFILSDVEGLYTADPSQADARLVDHVSEITDEIESMAGAPKPVGLGSGGMITKIAAARIAVASGCQVIITSGVHDRPLSRYRKTGTGTWFQASGSPSSMRKQWLAGALKPSGVVVVDSGAARALAAGKSLLPAGVTGLKGDFERGDLVTVEDEQGHELARGLVAFAADEAKRILGHRSDAIEDILGYRGRGELIHRDHLVVL